LQIEVRFVDRAQRVIPPEELPLPQQNAGQNDTEPLLLDGQTDAKKGKRKAVKAKAPPTQDQLLVQQKNKKGDCGKTRRAIPALAHR
jgi:hypothetical protein